MYIYMYIYIYIYIYTHTHTYHKPSEAAINKWFSCLMFGGGGGECGRHINYSRKNVSYHEILHTDYRDPLRTAVDLQEKFTGFVFD